jgi:tRNA (guanine26-N2/guanine27-N2)-dimethyltransferase
MGVKTVLIDEGAVKLQVPDPEKYKLTAKAPAFYNPDMRLNRDMSILLLKAVSPRPQSALDLLAATGVRGLRIKKEAGIERVYVNDASPTAFGFIKRNAKLNHLRITPSNKRAHEFLATRYKLKDSKFGYVDIDPFGTPVPFLDAGVKALVENRSGIIAVTATDTSSLCGTYPSACLRKYGSKPLYNYLMNEIGLRILVKKVQEMGAMYDIALVPIFAHTTRHYMRAYLRAERGADKTDTVLKQIGMFQGAGPLWLGPLYDVTLVEKMYRLARTSRLSQAVGLTKTESRKLTKEFGVEIPTKFKTTYETEKLLYTINKEAPINVVGFFDLAEMRLKQVPKITSVVAALKDEGFAAARTHFSATGIKTDASKKEFKQVLKQL